MKRSFCAYLWRRRHRSAFQYFKTRVGAIVLCPSSPAFGANDRLRDALGGGRYVALFEGGIAGRICLAIQRLGRRWGCSPLHRAFRAVRLSGYVSKWMVFSSLRSPSAF